MLLFLSFSIFVFNYYWVDNCLKIGLYIFFNLMIFFCVFLFVLMLNRFFLFFGIILYLIFVFCLKLGFIVFIFLIVELIGEDLGIFRWKMFNKIRIICVGSRVSKVFSKIIRFEKYSLWKINLI